MPGSQPKPSHPKSMSKPGGCAAMPLVKVALPRRQDFGALVRVFQALLHGVRCTEDVMKLWGELLSEVVSEVVSEGVSEIVNED